MYMYMYMYVQIKLYSNVASIVLVAEVLPH